MLSADRIVADPSANFMIHQPSGGTADGNRLALNRIVSRYLDRSTLGYSRAEVEGVVTAFGDVGADVWQAKEWGLADELGDAARALQVAHELARSWPCWPESADSVRHRVLEARAGWM